MTTPSRRQLREESPFDNRSRRRDVARGDDGDNRRRRHDRLRPAAKRRPPDRRRRHEPGARRGIYTATNLYRAAYWNIERDPRCSVVFDNHPVASVTVIGRGEIIDDPVMVERFFAVDVENNPLVRQGRVTVEQFAEWAESSNRRLFHIVPERFFSSDMRTLASKQELEDWFAHGRSWGGFQRWREQAPTAGGVMSAAEPVVVAPGGGEERSGPTGPFVMKASVEQTGSYALFENSVPPATYHEPHVHGDSEAFYVLDGYFEFSLDGRRVEAPAGTFVFIPAGVAHGYRAGADGARKLSISVREPLVGDAAAVPDADHGS